jgi:hypothetical protein
MATNPPFKASHDAAIQTEAIPGDNSVLRYFKNFTRSKYYFPGSRSTSKYVNPSVALLQSYQNFHDRLGLSISAVEDDDEDYNETSVSSLVTDKRSPFFSREKGMKYTEIKIRHGEDLSRIPSRRIAQSGCGRPDYPFLYMAGEGGTVIDSQKICQEWKRGD